MRIGRKKSKQTSVMKKVKRLCPELEREEIIAAFEFNLDPDIPWEKRDGVVIADREKVKVFLDGELTECVELCDVEEFKSDNGVGTVFMSYKKKSDASIRLLCIGDMSSSKAIIATVKRLNRIIERGIDYYDKMKSRSNLEDGGVGGRKI